MTPGLKWKLAAGSLLVFLAGATVGALIGNWRGLDRHRADTLARRMTEHLRHELALTPEQTAKIAPIIEQNAGKLEAVRGETARKVRGIFADFHAQISPSLTPEQREKLSAMTERRRQRRAHRRFWGPPPPPEQLPSP